MKPLDWNTLESGQGATSNTARRGGFRVDRRDFLKALGAGLFVCAVDLPEWAQESGGRFGRHSLPKNISAWLHISADNRVTVFTGKVEVGQNIRTSLAQQVAEELHVSFDSIGMLMGDTDKVPWDAGTFGSRTTPTMAPILRSMAAAARETLTQTAATRWHVDAAGLVAFNGKIIDKENSRSLTYGEITRGKNLVKIVAVDPALTPAKDWKIAGTPVPKAGIRKFVTGEHKYPSDMVRPNMLYGAMLRPEGFHATLDSIDTSAAEKMPGVKIIREGDFVGAVSADDFTAHQAVKAIHAQWTVPAQPSNEELFAYFKSHPASEGGRGPAHASGNVAQGMAQADVTHSQHYTVQYIAHCPLEPRAAVAEWHDGKVTVWTGTQRPFGIRDDLMREFQLPVDKVRVIQPDMGSAYGGKHENAAAIEAARLSKAVGQPVKVVWTREEEMTWAYFRPAGLIEVKAGARHDGTLLAWEHHNYNSGPSGVETPYKVANQLVQFHPTDSPLRQGSYRALAVTANNFARETHMDAMAHKLKMDPLQFRLKNLEDERLREVFEKAADKFGWDREASTPERGFGIAGGTAKNGYVATCAEVEIHPANKTIHIRRVVQAWDCGAIVNPNGLENQVMGALIQGMGGALFENIRFDNGRILNPLFSQYRLPRFKDVPQIEVILVDRKDVPSAGAGEIAIVGIAPAVGNALFAASGVRLCHMPMAPNKAIPGVEPGPFLS
jgi:isoquinoline 1-oxidoreductase